MLKINELYQGDCLEVMKSIDKGSIDLVVTSPPYDNLRDYNNYSFNFESTAQELYRVVKIRGVVVWVVGDSTVKGSESGTSFRQALYFKEIGFNLHDTMIYAKKAPIPLTHNRYEQQFEYMFVFSKSRPASFNPILEVCKTAGESNRMTHRRRSDELGKASGFGKVIKNTRYKYNIWYYHNNLKNLNHPAIFPKELAEDHILSWSNEKDLVLDPFAGSGTTGVACLNTNRNYILIEQNEKYCEVIRERLAQSEGSIFNLET